VRANTADAASEQAALVTNRRADQAVAELGQEAGNKMRKIAGTKPREGKQQKGKQSRSIAELVEATDTAGPGQQNQAVAELGANWEMADHNEFFYDIARNFNGWRMMQGQGSMHEEGGH
jgi:hypothetical protein